MKFIALLITAFLAMASASPPVHAQATTPNFNPAPSTKPNILFILTDDHRWDALGFLGHSFLKTPNLDRLAREGAHFENAFVTTSLCSPSRASILTGQYAHRHRVVDNYNPLPEGLTFFPEYLQEAGYETAFIGKWHIGGDIDDPQAGFDHWLSFKGQGIYFPDPDKAKVKGRYVPQVSNEGFNLNGRRIEQKGYITDELTDYALEWLKTRGRNAKANAKDNKNENDNGNDRPFFLYLSHKAVHADFLPANRHAFHYDDAPFSQPVSWAEDPERFHGVPMWVKNQRNSRHGVEFAYYMNLDLETYYRRYCETLLGVDESAGRLLKHLEDTGELDNTLILYMGDNGFLFGEHGLIDKRCAYEASMRVPMLMRWPQAVKPGTRVTRMVANIDVGPTLLDAAGLEIPGQMDGESFLPLARGEENVPWRDALLYEYYWERNYPQTPTTHAVREDRFKYIRYHGIWDTDELYDVASDPDETRNLINDPAHAGRVAAMNAKLFDLLKSTDGMDLPLVEDRGTKFLHRKRDGQPAAEFPDTFLREPDPVTQDKKE